MEQPDWVAVGSSWRPRFEVTKPLASVELGLSGRNGRVKLTLRTKAARGTIAGLRWDGKDQDGRTAAAACYYWGLTVRAKGHSQPVHLVNDAFSVYAPEPVEGGAVGSCTPGITG